MRTLAGLQVKTFTENDKLIVTDTIIKLKEHNKCLDKFSCTKIKLVQLAISGIVGIGTGLAMLPIFDSEVQELSEAGLIIDEYNVASIGVSINTLAIFSTVSTIALYHYMSHRDHKDESTPFQKIALDIAKVASLCSAILPVSQLWAIEVTNQSIVGSSGFDEYLAWATFTTLPLCIYKSLEAFEHLSDFVLNKLHHINLDSIGSNLFVYMPTLLSATGRFIAYTASAAYLGTELGMGEELSLVMGALIGGVAGSSVIGVAEHNSLKWLFEKREENTTWKQKLGGAICALEGILLTLPLVTTGMEAVKEWNPVFKGMIFSPLFISHSIYEGRCIYKAIEKLFHVQQDIEGQLRLISMDGDNESYERFVSTDLLPVDNEQINIAGDSEIVENI